MKFRGRESFSATIATRSSPMREKELLCRFATEKASELRKKLESDYRHDPQRYGREALEKEIAFYEGVPDTLIILIAKIPSNHTLQRTRYDAGLCNPRVSRSESLSLGR
jgi:hypothetical protein